MPKKTSCPIPDADLTRLLRKKHTRPYTLRLLIQDAPELKPRRVEVSLHTYSADKALDVARTLVQTLHCLGFRFSHKQGWSSKTKDKIRALPLFSWGHVFAPTKNPCSAENNE